MMDSDKNTPGVIVHRYDSLFAIESRSSDKFIADADIQENKKKKDKISEINLEIERRKTAFELI